MSTMQSAEGLLAAFEALVKRRPFEVGATAAKLGVEPKRVRNCIDALRMKGHDAVAHVGKGRFKVVA
jgi:predicted ArsR family transcriptional regulator